MTEYKDEFYDCLNMADKQAIDEFVLKLGLNEPPLNLDGQSGVQERLETYLESLVSAVLHTLLLGTARTAGGYKSDDIESTNALVKVAPGVFHISYVKVRITRRFPDSILTATRNWPRSLSF